jgi:hypothetical protein
MRLQATPYRLAGSNQYFVSGTFKVFRGQCLSPMLETGSKSHGDRFASGLQAKGLTLFRP